MYKREEASRIRQEFWTTFGRYMSPILSSEGMKINWVNYHTRLKDVHFRMHTGTKSAAIFISIEHADPNIRGLYFEQFLELKTVLHNTLQEEWRWEPNETVEDDKVIGKIYKEISDVSVFNKENWHELISFFKPRIIALDAFWENAKWSFEGLK